MIDLLGFGDPERWIIILLIILSLYFLWTNVENQVYNKRTKILLTIPRIYLIIYEVIIITDFYNVSRSIGEVFKTGYGGVIGILLLFAVETYVRWISKKYGRC